MSNGTTNCYLSKPIQLPGSLPGLFLVSQLKINYPAVKSSNYHTQPSPSIFFSLYCSILQYPFLFLSSPPHHAPLCPTLVKQLV